MTWKIVRRTATEAAVVIERSSSGTGGTGHEVYLRKREGAWWVVDCELTWMS